MPDGRRCAAAGGLGAGPAAEAEPAERGLGDASVTRVPARSARGCRRPPRGSPGRPASRASRTSRARRPGCAGDLGPGLVFTARALVAGLAAGRRPRPAGLGDGVVSCRHIPVVALDELGGWTRLRADRSAAARARRWRDVGLPCRREPGHDRTSRIKRTSRFMVSIRSRFHPLPPPSQKEISGRCQADLDLAISLCDRCGHTGRSERAGSLQGLTIWMVVAMRAARAMPSGRS